MDFWCRVRCGLKKMFPCEGNWIGLYLVTFFLKIAPPPHPLPMWANPLLRLLEEVGPENFDFFSGPPGTHFARCRFKAQKSCFERPTPSNGPRNGPIIQILNRWVPSDSYLYISTTVCVCSVMAKWRRGSLLLTNCDKPFVMWCMRTRQLLRVRRPKVRLRSKNLRLYLYAFTENQRSCLWSFWHIDRQESTKISWPLAV